MSRVNVLDAIPDGEKTNPGYDCTAKVQEILGAGTSSSTGNSAYFPVRRDGAGNLIPYWIRYLNLPNYSVIECESPNTWISAGDREDWIIDSHNTPLNNIRISGGTWRKCKGVFRQRTGENGGYVTNAIFEKMQIRDADRGFQIARAAHCVWRDLDFRGERPGGEGNTDVNVGILVIPAADDYFNGNLIETCRFLDYNNTAILFSAGAGGTEYGQKFNNEIRRCMFEADLSDLQTKGAIRIGPYTYGLAIHHCYFEETGREVGEVKYPDILLDHPGHPQGPRPPDIRSVQIRENTFAFTTYDAQEARIGSKGWTSFLAADNEVFLAESADGQAHQVFAHCEGLSNADRDSRVWLHRNLLFYARGENSPKPTYEAALYSTTGDGQHVDVEPHPASLGVVNRFR